MRKVINESLRKRVLFGLLAGSIAISVLTFMKEDQSEEVVGATNTLRPFGLKKQQTLSAISSNPSHTGYASRSFYTPSIDIFGDSQPATPEPQTINKAVKIEDSPIKKVDIQPQVIVSAPPVMPAPPPFKFIGKLYGDDEYIVFLNYNGKNIAVKTGEVLFEKYKVEDITPPTMTLVNLPLSTKETISIGEP